MDIARRWYGDARKPVVQRINPVVNQYSRTASRLIEGLSPDIVVMRSKTVNRSKSVGRVTWT
jgi:hypothetical protein